jgi:hypothetical protein
MKIVNPVKANMLTLFVLFLAGWLTACAQVHRQQGNNTQSTASSLDVWLEKTLIPHLVQQFGRHPRFKGQPILLVAMEGNNVQPRINELTVQIRGKIIDALLKEPGLNLSWRPVIQPWKHHRSLEDLSCGGPRKIHYYVGIDSGLTMVEGDLFVKVRALNLAEQKWVSGFGRSWQGAPTPAQLAALNRQHPDDYLRGLRPLPFSDRQPDLLAAYLAHNLSCLLRQGEEDALVVYVEKASNHIAPVFQTAFELVGKYLARFREVEVTENPHLANVTLVTDIHVIHQDFYQVWVSARHCRGAKYLPGAETEAYVLIDSSEQTTLAATGAKLSREPSGLNAEDAMGKAEGSANMKWPRESLIPIPRVNAVPSLFSSFDLLTPVKRTFCGTDDPWSAGFRRVKSHEHLSSNACLAVEMRLSTPAFVFLVSESANGELTSMFPSDCPALRKPNKPLRPGELFRFPSFLDPEAGILELDGSPGMESVYAIAITEPVLARQFENRLGELRGLCRPAKRLEKPLSTNFRPGFYASVQPWHGYLNQLTVRYPGMMQWRMIRFWHDPS